MFLPPKFRCTPPKLWLSTCLGVCVWEILSSEILCTCRCQGCVCQVVWVVPPLSMKGLMSKINYARLRVTPVPIDGKVANLLRTSCGLVGDNANKSAATDPRRIMNFLETIGAVTRPPDREWERERESAARWQQVVVMKFRKRHDTTHTTDFCPRQLVTDLLFMLRTCCGLLRGSRLLVMDLLRGKLM